MKFVDEAEVLVRSGKGGHGAVSFRRERFIPRGGPDGGNGGDGGCIFFIADEGLNTLADFRGHNRFFAKDGKPGQSKNCYGPCAKSIYIPVPLGTQIYISETAELLGEILYIHDQLLVVKGGKGGLGNARFKSSTNQAPRKSTPGGAAQELKLHLELKVLADVGLIGLPNAGKSSLTQSASGSNTPVADYPFTTLYPHLAVVESDVDRRWILADVPGLIEGASEGFGLGIRFLKHLSRVKVVLYVLDASLGKEHILSHFKILRNEMSKYHDSMLEKPCFIALNKCDLLSNKQKQDLKTWSGKHFEAVVFLISAKTQMGLDDLKMTMQNFLDQFIFQQDDEKQ